MDNKLKAVLQVLNTLTLQGEDNWLKVIAITNTIKEVIKEMEEDGNKYQEQPNE